MFDIANQLQTRHSPFVPLCQVDEWMTKCSPKMKSTFLFNKGLCCLYNKILIILTRRALTNAESKIATFRLPCCSTRLSLKWKLTNPRHATSRNLLQISCQTINAVEDRTFYSSLAMVTTIMWLLWLFEKSRDSQQKAMREQFFPLN